MAGLKRDPNANMVVARDVICIVVGARPIQYGTVTVAHNKTNEIRTIDNQNVIVDEGDPGVPYTFKAFQRVNKNHPAVLANPDAFMPADEVDETVVETLNVA